MKETVGLVGVGTMGQAVLKNLMEAGYAVVACDPSPASRAFVTASGASLRSTPAQVTGDAKVVLLSLPAPRHVKAVVCGEHSISEQATEEHIIVDTSTVDPGTSRDMAQILGKSSTAYLDAPILGRPVAVGNWVLVVGGPHEALATVKPVLSVFAKDVVHVGPSGSGNILKLLNQLMFSVINGITAEVFALADKAGLSKEVFFDTVSASGAATMSGLFCECGKKVIADDYAATFSLELLCKDAGLGIDMAKAFGATPVIASTVQIFNEIARDTGYRDLDTSALKKVFDHLYASKTP